VHAVIDDGKLEVGRGPIEGAQVIDPGPTLKDLMTRTITVPEAMATGMVNCDQDALASFVSMFALPKLTVPQPAAA
jgi:hypothetical protein